RFWETLRYKTLCFNGVVRSYPTECFERVD
ncbi:MAG: hypothetical protein ACI9CU_001241, partial [Polaribacter sp.]